MLDAYPLAGVVVVAVVARLSVAVASFMLNPAYLIPDEHQYVQLARAVSEGGTAESWFPVFGQSLYDHTWAFTAPIRLLFDVLWPSRFFGQMYAAVFGVLAAVLTVVLARKIVRPRLAVLAGLLVAVLPSQVLWSSVVLRESLMWAAMALVAVGFAATFTSARSTWFGVAAVVVGLVAMGASRDQTMLATAWALPIAALLVRDHRRLYRLALCGALAVLLPAVMGIGPGGWDLVEQGFPSLATTRAALSDQAGSSYSPTTLLPTTTDVAPSTTTDVAPSGATTTTTLPTTVTLDGGREGKVVRAPSGAVYVVDESLKADFEAIPRGTVAVFLRPFPWEGGSFALRLAAFEEPIWYALYALAGYGLWWARRRLEVVALPFVMAAGAMAAEILIQGNIGTAFRHRGQILWALALFAACGAEAIMGRHRDGAPGADDGESARSIDGGNIVKAVVG